MVVLVVSVHPDDEMIGAGGVLLKHKANGDIIVWLIVTAMKNEEGFTEERIQERENEIKLVASQVPFDHIEQLNIPTMKMDTTVVVNIIPLIGQIFNKYKPEVIYTVNRSDAHSDHRLTFSAVMACTKSFRYPFIKKILMYECLSETEFAPALAENVFVPNYFVDITAFLDKKIEILSIYKSEMGDHPFPRSNRNIKALATFRGAQAGVEYAEAFQLIHYIDK